MSVRSKSSALSAREAALQMVYAVDVGGQTADTVERWYMDAHPLPTEAAALAVDLLGMAVDRKSQIESLLDRHAIGWRVERMSAVDRSLLKIAVAEFLLLPRTDRNVIVRASMQLARKYSQPEAENFIRGVLDAVARELASDSEVAPHAQ